MEDARLQVICSCRNRGCYLEGPRLWASCLAFLRFISSLVEWGENLHFPKACGHAQVFADTALCEANVWRGYNVSLEAKADVVPRVIPARLSMRFPTSSPCSFPSISGSSLRRGWGDSANCIPFTWLFLITN